MTFSQMALSLNLSHKTGTTMDDKEWCDDTELQNNFTVITSATEQSLAL